MPSNFHSLLLIRSVVTSFIAVRPRIARISRIFETPTMSFLIRVIRVIRG